MKQLPLVLLVTALTILFTCQANGADSAPSSLHVMSFNIRYGTANDGANAWPLRKHLVAGLIRTHKPDLVGTQETLPFQASQLQADLPDYEYRGWSRDSPLQGEQCGIFFLRERFRLKESGNFWLSETPEVKYTRSWDSSLPRIATWLLLEDQAADHREVLILNTHFDHRGETARQKSAEIIREFLEGQPPERLLLMTGDLNCGEDSVGVRHLLGSDRLRDTYRPLNKKSDEEGTFSGFEGRTRGARIDWVLVDPRWEVRSAAILRDNENGQYPSDHYPVAAVLDYPDAE